ncbi:MAG: phospholipid carrier-dependent glycosyltransferase [Cyanobacteria bacterium J083]|nr:MAG: phospholipid carrier-dependent glycosyltransferase [Cyanobacteria bacterium J083]
MQHKKLLKPTVALFLGVGLIYLAFLKPGIWGFDGNDMLNVAKSLVTEGDFTVPAGAGIQGRGGEYYSIRYPLLPIIATPFVAVGLFFADLFKLPPHYTSAVFALLVSLILTAITTALVMLLALRLGSSAKGAYLAAICYAFGTTALVYGREFFAEPLLALITTASFYFALGKSTKSQAIASILAGLAIIAKPAGIVIGPVLSAYLYLKRYSLKSAIGPILGSGMGVLLYLGYNFMRFGNILSSGQNTDRLQLEGFFARLVGLIISPGAGGGLLWYCPPVILAFWGLWRLWKIKPLETLAILGIFSGYWILHSFWRFAGWNWGPRFLVPVLPILMASTALLKPKWWKWLIGLTVVGFLVNAPTLISFYQRYYAEANDGGYLSQALALWGNPADAPIFNAWGAAWRQLQDALATNVTDVINQAGAPPEKGTLLSAELLKILAVWWWVLPAAGIPLWVGILLAVSLVAMGVWILQQGWQQLKSQKSLFY